MKKTFLLAIILFPIFGVNAQEKLTANQQKVQNTITGLFQSLADRDTIKIKSYCIADILLLENGIVWNLDTLIQKISENKAADFKRINTIEFIDTKVSGDVAWATYNNQAEVTRNGKQGFIKWLETVILIREEKTWKIKVLHSTLIKRS